jgi:putative heme-binding domain-containing protein
MRLIWIVLLLSPGILCTPVSAADPTDSLGILVRTLAATENDSVRTAVLRGMLKGLYGRRGVNAPEGWQQLSVKLKQNDNDEIRELTEQLSQIFGDQQAIQRSLATLQNQQAEPAARRKALQALLMQRSEAVAAELPSLLDQSDLRLAAIRGFGLFALPDGPTVLLSRYKKLRPQEQRAVIETLATRKDYAVALVDAVAAGTIDQKEIPVYVARSLREIVGERFTKVYGEIPELEQNTRRLIAKYRTIIEPKLAAADASQGRLVFQKTCASCHLMYGQGGKIGPDLTGSNRANLDYILLNSLAPSEDVPAGYRMVIIATEDGRVLNGVIGEEDEQRIILKTVDQPELVILKDEIVARKVSEKSMMPEGQLQQLPQQDLFDLIKYLQTTEQVEPAKS